MINIFIVMFFIGCTGLIFNKSNILKLVLSLELILLSCTLILIFNYNFSMLIISIFIIVIAGVESVIGLSLLINYKSKLYNKF